MADSSNLKEAVMRQVQIESNTANVRILMEKMNESCYERCVPKPGSSLSNGESACFTACMDKYMAAWNQVNSAYITRIKKEQASR